MKNITKIGVIGCGNICDIYFQNCKKLNNIEVIAAADLDISRAKAKAEKYGFSRACSVDEILADDEIDIILNLTIPKAHAEIALRALGAGKHVYSEKPLALNRKDGKAILDLAKSKGLLVGAAPDTFLGQGLQTCRKLIDDGVLGNIIAGNVFMMCPGHESWHPAPQFYYQKGGGPMLDMGPYYLTALVNMLGPVKSVIGAAKITRETRTITSQPFNGQQIKVEVPTHIAGILNFVSGATIFITTSFDVCCHSMPPIELYGSKARLIAPDPNIFGGHVTICSHAKCETQVSPVIGYPNNSRALGLADMADAIKVGRQHRASGDLAYHVLDIMLAINESSNISAKIDIQSSVNRPATIGQKDINVLGMID